jgi:hypothetical protein
LDDRFDRRELLLHLGEVLEAMRCVAHADRPDALIARLTNEVKSLQQFTFLSGLAPTMIAADFVRQATKAYSRWPMELLEQELNRDTLASSVRQALFVGNPDGWKAFAAHIQAEVKWFGTALAEKNADVAQEMNEQTLENAASVENPDQAANVGRMGPIGRETRLALASTRFDILKTKRF